MGKYNPKELTINYKKILKATSIAERVELAKSQSGQNILSVLTPSELGELFPDYYKKKLPDVSGFLAARKNNQTITPTNSPATYTPTTVRNVERQINQQQQQTQTTNTPSTQPTNVRPDANLNNKQKLISDLANEYGINPRALAGIFSIESNISTDIRGGYKNNFYGVFQLQSQQIPNLTNKAGLGRLTPEQYTKLSLSDQLKVYREYIKGAGITKGFFTGDEKQDAARLWALQLSPGNAKKINYNDPNAVISATNQAKSISAGQNLVTVGSVQNETIRRGKSFYPDEVMTQPQNVPNTGIQQMKGNGKTIVTGAWGHEDVVKMYQGTGASFVRADDIKGIVTSIQQGNNVTLFSQSAGKTQMIINEMKSRGMSDDQIKDLFSKNVHIAQPHNSADTQIKSLIEKGYIKPENVVVGPAAANGANLSSIKGVIQNNEGHLESAGYFAKQNIVTNTPQLQTTSELTNIPRLLTQDQFRKGETGEFNYFGDVDLNQGPVKNLVKLKTSNGLEFQVRADVAPRAKAFIEELESKGYKINNIGGYAHRRNVNSPGNWSTHATGGTLDINPDQNPNKQSRTDFPDGIEQLAWKHGFSWGGRFNDPMHFETMSPSARLNKLKSLVNSKYITQEQADDIIKNNGVTSEFLKRNQQYQTATTKEVEDLQNKNTRKALNSNANPFLKTKNQQSSEEIQPKRAALLAAGTNDWDDEEKAYQGLVRSVKALRNKGEEPTLVLPAKEIHGKPHAYNAALRVANELQLKTETPKSFGKGDDHYHLSKEAADDIKSRYQNVPVYGDSNAVRLGAKEQKTGFTGAHTGDIADRLELQNQPQTPPQMQSGGTVGDDVQAVPLNNEVGSGKEDTVLINQKGQIEALAKSDETVQKSPNEGDTQNRIIPKTRTRAEEISETRQKEYEDDVKENFELTQKRQEAKAGIVPNITSNMDKIKDEIGVATGYVSTDAMNRVINRARMSKIPGDYHYDQNSANII